GDPGIHDTVDRRTSRPMVLVAAVGAPSTCTGEMAERSAAGERLKLLIEVLDCGLKGRDVFHLPWQCDQSTETIRAPSSKCVCCRKGLRPKPPAAVGKVEKRTRVLCGHR